MTINVLGIDIAKNTFQLHGADCTGKAVLKKRLPRHKLAAYAATLPACTIVMESCAEPITGRVIHGARAVLSHRKVLDSNYDRWVAKKKATLSHNKAAVALANKNARIIWSMLNTGGDFNQLSNAGVVNEPIHGRGD